MIAPLSTATPTFGQTISYTSLIELRQALAELDDGVTRTVVLVLDSAFSGHLSSLIERAPGRRGDRLILTAESGRLPGLDTIADLAIAGNSLGWEEIIFDRRPASAVADAQGSLRDGEELLIFSPSWTSPFAARGVRAWYAP